jgi:hypothetical protein
VQGGGLVLNQHVSRDTEMDNATLVMGHQADPVHCYIPTLQTDLQYTIFYNITLGLGKTTIARIDSWRYS